MSDFTRLIAIFVLSLMPISASADESINVRTAYGGELRFVFLGTESPTAAVILFPGGPGYLNPSRNGKIRRQKNSFLAHNTTDFADAGFLVAVFNPPSGMKDLGRPYRMSDKHGQDIQAVVDFLKDRADVPVWLIGHSRGTFSAANGAIRLEGAVAGLVLTSAVTKSRERYSIYTTHPNGVIDMDLASVSAPVMIVANKTDSCASTPPSNAGNLAGVFTGAATIAVKLFDGSGRSKPDNCKMGGQHHFDGFDDDVVEAIAAFIKSNGAKP
jgi:pimeloyl-ACP methyl ester carboxylesterase